MRNLTANTDPILDFLKAPHRMVRIYSGYIQPSPGIKSEFVRAAESMVADMGATREWTDTLKRTSIWSMRANMRNGGDVFFFVGSHQCWLVDGRRAAQKANSPHTFGIPFFFQTGENEGSLAGVWNGDSVLELAQYIDDTGTPVAQIERKLAGLTLSPDVLGSSQLKALTREREVIAIDRAGGVLLQIGDQLQAIEGPNLELSLRRMISLIQNYKLKCDPQAFLDLHAIVAPKGKKSARPLVPDLASDPIAVTA